MVLGLAGLTGSGGEAGLIGGGSSIGMLPRLEREVGSHIMPCKTLKKDQRIAYAQSKVRIISWNS